MEWGQKEERDPLEKQLSALMEFQKFEGDAGLQALIDATHGRYSAQNEIVELDEEEMAWVAGGTGETPDRKRPLKTGD